MDHPVLAPTAFWVAAVAAAPLWAAAIFFPRAHLTRRLWDRRLAPLPFGLAFTVSVLPHLRWWLGLFVNPELALVPLAHAFSTPRAFLLLWFYILCFDVAVFADMHARLLRRNAAALEMSVWALITAVCAPLGLITFNLLEALTEHGTEDDAEVRAAAEASAARVYFDFGRKKEPHDAQAAKQAAAATEAETVAGGRSAMTDDPAGLRRRREPTA